MSILGIGDASEYDTFPTTDWKKAADMGCKFGIVRATTTGAWNYVTKKPNLKEDLRFLSNVQAMDAVGIKHYPYCWFDPRSSLTSLEQADFFVTTIKKVGPSDIIIADVENATGVANYDANSIVRLRNWLIEVEAIMKQKPAIYSFPTFINSLASMSDTSWMSSYPLIIAHWDVNSPNEPYPWFPGSRISWQYTGNMLGSRYGFNAIDKNHTTPRICMAVM